MSYTPLPLASGSTLENTRDGIRGNFVIIQDRFEDDHTTYASGTGKHNKMTMPEQSSAPTTAANEGALYSKVGTNPAETNLFFRAESDGYEYQMTHAYSANTGTFATSPFGWTFLPGGLILQWGSLTNPGTSGTITFADNTFSFPNSIIQIQLQIYHNSSGNESATVKQDDPPTTALFKYRTTSSSANTVLKWYALGN